jgi:enoyl-CoA hydratase
LTGRTIDATEALSIGLLTEIDDDPVARALGLAAEIAAFPQETVRSDRRAVLEGEGLELRAGLALEAALGRERIGAALSGANRFNERPRNS